MITRELRLARSCALAASPDSFRDRFDKGRLKMTCTKTRSAKPPGEYQRTPIDDAKEAADYLIVACGRLATIQWRDGLVEHVSRRRLSHLQATYTSHTDF